MTWLADWLDPKLTDRETVREMIKSCRRRPGGLRQPLGALQTDPTRQVARQRLAHRTTDPRHGQHSGFDGNASNHPQLVYA
jgi:hypothetical protein